MMIGNKYVDFSDVKDVLIIMLLVAVGGKIVGETIYDSNFDKEKDELCDTIKKDLNYNSVDVKNFDFFITNDQEYLFKFTGSATNSMDKEIDFFACSYEVSENQFNDMMEYLSNKKLDDIRNLDSLGILKKLNSIVKDAELVSHKENTSVVTEQDQTNVILNVSKAKVNGDQVSYYVSYATPVKDKNGNLGLKKTLAEVSYDLTDDLSKNPNAVFLLPKEKAKVKVMEVEQNNLEVFQLKTFNNPSADRKKL